MMAFLFAPIGAFAGTFVLRHAGTGSIAGSAASGALAAALLMVPMAILLVKLWDEAQSLADVGQIYLHNETFAPKAAAYLDRAIALAPGNARYHTLRGIALARMDGPATPLPDWDMASRLAPQDPEPHLQRGVYELRRGALAAALEACQLALAKNPGHARAHACLGAVWEQQQDPQRAFEHYDRAIALGPDDATVRCDRSFANLRRGDAAKALEDAYHAVRLQRHLGLARAALGHALLALGRPEEAAEAFQEALERGVEPAIHQDVLRALEPLDAGEGEEPAEPE
jgi:tetratricopeptide (TPR) repeat protein